VFVWDVLGKRTANAEYEVAGGVKAPDVEMALLLARETHFRHKEGVAYAVRRRGERTLHEGPWTADELGGVTDRSYRRQEAYAGVGGRLKKLSERFASEGVRIDAARPPAHRAAPPREGHEPSESEASDTDALTPERLAAEGTAG
jgi:1,2-phenylacetyl-CoA epoxidase PaaB subunit